MSLLDAQATAKLLQGFILSFLNLFELFRHNHKVVFNPFSAITTIILLTCLSLIYAHNVKVEPVLLWVCYFALQVIVCNHVTQPGACNKEQVERNIVIILEIDF